MQSPLQLKASPLLQVKPIERRANCKIVQMDDRSYLIGGMTGDAISNQIFQFKLDKVCIPERVEWREIHFDNNLFSPRNSFTACCAKGKIYIWGGLQFHQNQQRTLSDFIQLDVDTRRMRQIPLKTKIKIHSSTLFFDDQKSQFLAYGGSDQNANLPAYLYTLKFQPNQEEYEWQKLNITCPQHQGYIWQHSSIYTKSSLFNGDKGSFLTVIGGCRLPQTPYKSIVEINIDSKKVTNSIQLQNGLVSHDAVVRQGILYIFGGSNGGDFNSTVCILNQGKLFYLKGHRAIGCCCCLLQSTKIIVYGGVCGQASINGAFIYE